MYYACEQGHKNIVELLIKRGADVNAGKNLWRNDYAYPIQIASVKGDVELIRVLIDNGASLDNLGNARLTGSTKAHTPPLHLAFDNGHLEVAEFLVQRGSFIDSVDAAGETLLRKATKSCCLDKMHKFLSFGASAKCVNEKEETALHLVLADVTRGPTATASQSAFDSMDSRIYSHQRGDNSPLIISISSSDASVKNKMKSDGEIAGIVEVLLEVGVDCNSECSDGETLLHRACERQLGSVVKFLIDAKCEVNKITVGKKHQIVIACQRGCKKNVEYLLAAGANVNIVPWSDYARLSTYGTGASFRV